MSFLKTPAKKERDTPVSARQPTYTWVADKNALHGGQYQEVKDCGFLGLTAAALALLRGRGVALKGKGIVVPDGLEQFADTNGDGILNADEALKLAPKMAVATEDFWHVGRKAPPPRGSREFPGPDEPEGFGGERYDGKTFSERFLPHRAPSELDAPKRKSWFGDDGDSEEEEEDSDSEVDDPVEEGEIWEDAQSKPPPESPGLLMVSTHIKF